MSAIPAGSAEIEIRGKLEALKADLVQAEAEWAKHETKVTKSAAQAAKERVAAIKAALKEQERALAQTLAAQERAQRDADAAAARSAKEVAKAQAVAAREASQARIAEEKRVSKEQRASFDAAYAEAKIINDKMIADAKRVEKERAAIAATRAREDAAAAQAGFNSILGVSPGATTNSARASASVFAANFKEQEEAAKAVARAQAESAAEANRLARELKAVESQQQDLLNRAIRLTSEYDVEYGAQLRLNRALSEANTLREKGIIDEQRQAAIAKNAQLQYDKFVKSQQSSKAGGLAQYQLTNLSFQANDVITGILSGQPLGQIAAQQGGQIFQILQTSAGGFSGALKGLLTPLNLTIAGVGALAVAAGAVALQMHKGAEQVISFNNSLKLFGGTSGIGTNEILAETKTIAENAHVGISGIRDLGLAIVQTGQVGKEAFAPLVEGSTLLAKATGTKAVDAFNTFKPLLGDTTQAAIDLNQQFHFLTAEQLKQVQTLQEQGDKMAAVKLVMDSFNNSAKDQQENLGALEKWWRELNRELSVAKDLLMDIGRASVQATGVDAEKAAVGKLIQARDTLLQKRDNPVAYAITSGDHSQFSQNDQGVLDSLNQQIGLYEKMKGQYGSLIERAEARKKIEEDAGAVELESVKNGAQIRAKKEQIAIVEKAIAEGVGDQAEHAKTLVTLNEQLAKLQKPDAVPGAARAAALAREEAALRENIKATWELADAYQKGGDIALKAEADRQGAVDATKKGIALATRQQLQLNLTIAKTAADASQQSNQLKEQTASQIRANAAVQAGTMTREQANQQIQLEAMLYPLVTAQKALENKQDAESIAAKQKLADLIELLTNNYGAYNDSVRDSQLTDEIENQKKQNELLQLQIDLIGKSNRERAVALAQRQAEIEFDQKYPNGSAGDRKAYVDAAKAGANLGQDQADKQQKYDLSNAAIGIGNVSSGLGDLQRTADDAVEIHRAAYEEIARLRAADVIDEKQAAQLKADADAKLLDARLHGTQRFLGALESLTQSSNDRLKEIGKAAAIVDATINTYKGINHALGEGNWVEAASIAVEGFANVSAIAGMATGGIVTGSGGPTQDNQLRRLSVGEGVITAKGVRANPGLVEHINAGGTVASSVMVPAGSAASSRAANYNMPAPPQRVQVEVAVRNDGTLQAYVDQRATDISAKTVKNYSTNAMPQRQTQISRQPRVRGGKR